MAAVSAVSAVSAVLAEHTYHHNWLPYRDQSNSPHICLPGTNSALYWAAVAVALGLNLFCRISSCHFVCIQLSSNWRCLHQGTSSTMCFRRAAAAVRSPFSFAYCISSTHYAGPEEAAALVPAATAVEPVHHRTLSYRWLGTPPSSDWFRELGCKFYIEFFCLALPRSPAEVHGCSSSHSGHPNYAEDVAAPPMSPV